MGAEDGRQTYCLFLLLVYMQHGPLQNTSSNMKLSRMSRQQLNTLIRADFCQVQSPGWLPRCTPMTLTLNPGALVWNSSLCSGQGHVSKIMFPERDWEWLGKGSLNQHKWNMVMITCISHTWNGSPLCPCIEVQPTCSRDCFWMMALFYRWCVVRLLRLQFWFHNVTRYFSEAWKV